MHKNCSRKILIRKRKCLNILYKSSYNLRQVNNPQSLENKFYNEVENNLLNLE